jgi:microcystin-dependent protein
MPAHTHAITGSVTPQAATDGSLSNDAAGKYLGPGSFYAPAGDNVNMAPIPATGLNVGITGNSSPVSVMQPYLGMNYVICMFGIFPSRN